MCIRDRKEAVGGDLPEFLSLLITHYEEAELAEEAGGTPSQSTVKQEVSGLGVEAQREILQNYLKDKKTIAEYIETESEMCIRDSCTYNSKFC